MTRAARSANESFARLFKGGGGQRQSLWPRSAERGTPLCFIKRRRGFKGEPSPGVPPFIFVSTCAPIRWEVVVSLSCDSTPFLWCLPKETVSSRQRKALFLPWYLHHSRERYKSVDYTFLARLWGGAGGCLWVCACAPFSWAVDCGPNCPFHPISLLLRKETGWSPKETRLRVPPRGLFGPTRLSHGLEAPTSQPTASS